MPRWRVAGASVPGSSHRRTGQGCQDACRWQEVADGVLVVAVADGAGSAACADIGSAVAVQAAVEETAGRLHGALPGTGEGWGALLRTVFQTARLTVFEEAAKLEVPPSGLATTLLVAVVTSEGVAAGQVGDGAVIARLADGALCPVTRPPDQEYLNETTFLTSDSFIERTQFMVLSAAVTGLALLTDGLQMLALQMPQGAPHAAFFAPLLQLLTTAAEPMRCAAQLDGFLRSPRVAQRADDDLTLVLAVRDGV